MTELSLDALPELCDQIMRRLPHGGVVILQGDLASGKTTLVKAFAKMLHLDDAVTSPTFSSYNFV